ncbi:MAG: helix-turn-helix domain-containing protein [Actinoallomurus sp.]
MAVLFDCDLDREKIARALHIHRRALTYRIQRIWDLTRLDPATDRRSRPAEWCTSRLPRDPLLQVKR